jgi:hypothetical protein
VLEQTAWESFQQEVRFAPGQHIQATSPQMKAAGLPRGMTDSLAQPRMARARTRTRRRRRKRSWLAPWGYLPPALAVFGVFWVGPAGYSVYLSFFAWNMASPEKLFVAAENDQRVFVCWRSDDQP